MLRIRAALLASPYTQFLKETKNLPALKACKTIPERGRTAAALYKKLSATDKAALVKRANSAAGKKKK